MQKPAYERRISDWSSDVCSSDLARARAVLDVADVDDQRRRLPVDRGDQALEPWKVARLLIGKVAHGDEAQWLRHGRAGAGGEQRRRQKQAEPRGACLGSESGPRWDGGCRARGDAPSIYP